MSKLIFILTIALYSSSAHAVEYMCDMIQGPAPSDYGAADSIISQVQDNTAALKEQCERDYQKALAQEQEGSAAGGDQSEGQQSSQEDYGVANPLMNEIREKSQAMESEQAPVSTVESEE